MNYTLSEVATSLRKAENIDLDQIATALQQFSDDHEMLATRTRLYETELQRELRAKIELCGGIPTCATPEQAYTLSGEVLLAARYDAQRKFNQAFFMAPLSRKKNLKD